MIGEFWRAFILVLMAEMGDKTQIMTMAFAAKYRIRDVLLGVLLGVFVNHGIAIVLGRAFSKLIPMNYIQILGAFMFIIFAYMSLLEEDDEEEDMKKENLGPILTVATTFFICELGDKSQLTALTLATNGDFPIFILLGTTLGMVGVSTISVLIGSKFGEKIPDMIIKLLSSYVFLIFGIGKLSEVFKGKSLFWLIFLSLVIQIFLSYRLIKLRKTRKTSLAREKAQVLYEQTRLVEEVVDGLCLGEAKCKHCSGSSCLAGYLSSLIHYSRENSDYSPGAYKDIDSLILKDYDEGKIREILDLLDQALVENKWDTDRDFVVNKIFYYLKAYLNKAQ